MGYAVGRYHLQLSGLNSHSVVAEDVVSQGSVRDSSLSSSAYVRDLAIGGRVLSAGIRVSALVSALSRNVTVRSAKALRG